MLVNCTLTLIKMTKFMLCIFYYIENLKIKLKKLKEVLCKTLDENIPQVVESLNVRVMIHYFPMSLSTCHV